ncbi:WD40 repeat domain-containing protein [Candidatus Sumerlaeota bacterium]|nr:WD40 repeat domain-containing protein [Candidatus Sumerlaeota bacterium]
MLFEKHRVTRWTWSILFAGVLLWRAACPVAQAESIPFKQLTDGANLEECFSEDGKWLIVSSKSGVDCWDLETGGLARHFGDTKSYYIDDVAFSPDFGKVLMAASFRAELFDFATGAQIHEFASRGGGYSAVACCPLGDSFLTGDSNGYLNLWDAASFQHIAEYSSFHGQIWDLDFAPNSRTAWIRSDSVDLVRFERDEFIMGWAVPLFSLPYPATHVFSPDGTQILVTRPNLVELRDTSTGDLVFSSSGGFEPNLAPPLVEFSQNGGVLLLAEQGQSQAVLYDAETGDTITTLTHSPSIESLRLAPDGQCAATNNGSDLVVWDVSGPTPTALFTNGGDFLSFNLDGSKFLTQTSGGHSRYYDLGTLDVLTSASGVASGGRIVDREGVETYFAFEDDTATHWNLDTEQVSRVVLQGLAGRYLGCLNDGGFFLSGAKVLLSDLNSLTLETYDVDSALLSEELTSLSIGACLDIDPSSNRMLLGGYPTELWDLETGSRLRSFGLQSYQVALFAQGDKFFAVDRYEDTGFIRSLTSGTVIASIAGDFADFNLNDVQFSPDGSRIVTAEGGYTTAALIRVWDVASGNPLLEIPDHETHIHSVRFSPDGTRIASSDDWDQTFLWDSQSGALVRSFSGSFSAFSHSGEWLATCYCIPGPYSERKVSLWDIETGEQIQQYATSLSQEATLLEFSSDDKTILVGGFDGVCQILEVRPPRAILVAGGGNYAGNSIARQTVDLGDYAYKTLKSRGYQSDEIVFLTAFGPDDPSRPGQPFRDADGDGLNDADAWSTLENLEEAVAGDFGRNAGRLMVLMIDHGHRTSDFMAFRMNQTQVLPSTVLDGWLDDLQASHRVDVSLIVDCCYSGQFVEDCRLTESEKTGALAGRRRIVAASTGPESEAVFRPAPDLTSFMHLFLGSAYMGNSIGEAWRACEQFFNLFPVADQTPLIDDGTTGTAIADREFFGATWAYGVQATVDANDFFPVFENWTTETLVEPGAPVTLWVETLSAASPDEVVAVVRPPAPDVISGQPVSSLGQLSLEQSPTTPTLWEVTTADTFMERGVYSVSFSARFPYERLSNPVHTRVLVSEGVDPDAQPIRAILTIGIGLEDGSSSTLSNLGPYAYRVYLDRFQDDLGAPRGDWIEYLSAHADPDRDDSATSSTFFSAIENLPDDLGTLYVHLAGDSSTPGQIALAGGDTIATQSLDQALDDYQAVNTSCTLILAIDAPGSGAFLPPCRATGAQKRIVLASGRENDPALFLPPPTLVSFSYKFLSAAYQGNNLLTAFRSAEDFYGYFVGAEMIPQMDDDGDGAYSPSVDGILAESVYLGRRYAFAGDDASGLPFIVDVWAYRSPGSSTANLQVRLVEGVEPTRVFVQVFSSDSVEAFGSVASLAEHELYRDSPYSWTWSAQIDIGAMTGTISVAFHAEYPDSIGGGKLSDTLIETVAFPPDEGTGTENWMLFR